MKLSDLSLLSYGTSPAADYYAKIIPSQNGKPKFDLIHNKARHKQLNLGRVTLKIPGRHNILNAAAVLAVVHQLGFSMPDAIEALGVFTGAGRRFEVLGSANGVTIIDDYGHHPTEISATLEAARSAYLNHRIWAVWQPHTFTRTITLEKDFIQALNLADRAIVLKIFAAREADPGYSAETIAKAVPDHKAEYIDDFNTATEHILNVLSKGDVAIFFSAGDATEISKAVYGKLTQRSNAESKSN